MKKITTLLFASVLVVGCSTADKPAPAPVAEADGVDDCQYDDGSNGAPSWVCFGEVEGYPVVAKGSYEKSSAGMSFMQAQAVLDARAQLAQEVRTKVIAQVANNTSTTGVPGGKETVSRAAKLVRESIASATLPNTKMLRRHIGPKGEVYVLVGMNDVNISTYIQEAIQTALNNEEALLQQADLEKGLIEMRERAKEEFGG